MIHLIRADNSNLYNFFASAKREGGPGVGASSSNLVNFMEKQT